MKKNIKISIIAVLLASTFISWTNSPYPELQSLQHAGTLFLVALLSLDFRKNKLSIFSFSCFAAFILIHIVGATWIYSNTPYYDWFSFLEETERNHYDRFVHFSFGLLVLPIVFERIQLSQFYVKLLLAWCLIQVFSLGYELFEWGLAKGMVSEQDAINYNGQQGDVWDAHKDMALAMLGSIVTSGIYLVKNLAKK